MCTDGNHSAVLTMQTDQSLFQRSGLCTESSHSSVLTTQTAQSLLQRPGLCTERSDSSVLTATENWTVYGKQSGRCPCLRDLDYVRRAVTALSLRLRRPGLITEDNCGTVFASKTCRCVTGDRNSSGICFCVEDVQRSVFGKDIGQKAAIRTTNTLIPTLHRSTAKVF